MTAERKWWPAEWVDETAPPSRSSPSEFIIDANGHYFLGYPLNADDVSEFEKRFYNTGIDPQDTVEFLYCDDLGTIRIEIVPDGRDWIAIDETPPDATHFWIAGDGESLAHSLEDFAKEWIATNGKPDKPQIVTVSLAHWSEGIPHQFMPAIEGKIGAQFVSLKLESETVQ